MVVLTKNTNFEDEYLGGKFLYRHETWHGDSEGLFLSSDQKLAKSLE